MTRVATILFGLTALVAASPVAYPQDLDFYGIITSAGLPSSIPIAIGVASQAVSWNPSAVIAAAAAEITLDPLVLTSDFPAATSVFPTSSVGLDNQVKRAASACSKQPIGYGPKATPDTVSAFLADPAFSKAALAAATPVGYQNTFKNLNASNNAYAYMGFTTLKTYNVAACAKQCNTMYGCVAINIYYERDPTVDPGSGSNCANPSSTTQIKCAFWGSPVNAANAVNTGQYRDQFQVVIAGSNGYVNHTVSDACGYNGTYLGNYAINAPDDCNGANTYMGYKFWNDALPFDVERCAAACSAQSAYDLAYPPAVGEPMTCQFFNTYLLIKNGVIQGQTCAMYNETWSPEYAVNSGYSYESDVYSIAYSYSFSNSTNAGTCVAE